MQIQYQNGAIFLPHLGLWLDAHEPQDGLVFVSHAHSDHTAPHREVIVSEPTARLMQARMPGTRREHVLPFRARQRFSTAEGDFEITLLPAGHIFGSAMALIRSEEEQLLYTGDFKLRGSLSAELCEPHRADILIMETTFGRPQYVFPSAADVLKGVIRFCREALDNDETPVLLGYSLGKSQEILCSLADAHFPLMLHGSVQRLTLIYEQFGQCFPKYERYDAGSARGKVLLCPPNVVNSAMLRNLGKTRTAILTGWAVDPNCKYRYQCDAAFPLSDHADYPELLALVEQVQPRLVYTLHGFAADFARTLRELGYDARALSEQEQFTLRLESAVPPPSAGGIWSNTPLPFAPSSRAEEPAEPGSGFITFATTCEAISVDPRKLEKVRLLAEFLKTIEGEGLRWAATWFTGRPFPPGENKVLQVGWAVLRDALCAAAGVSEQTFHHTYLKHSDLGRTADELLANRAAAATLTLRQVGDLFQRLHAARGPLGKTPLLRTVLERCTPVEAKYLVKIITGDLRIGLKEGLVEEAIAAAFAVPQEQVRNGHLLLGDIGETALLAREHKLDNAALSPFRPIRFMLASPEETAKDIWNRHLERAGEHHPAQPVWVEDKYDGIRCQLHKVGTRVALYSRDLKDITSTFLDLADSVRAISCDLVLDGEIVAMSGEQILPFAELQKRLGRREGDLFMRDEVPIKLVAFDLLWLNGDTLLNRSLRERRHLLETIPNRPNAMCLVQITTAVSVEEIESAFVAARARGNEGLMVKDAASAYTPGRRGLSWLKLKKAFATLDCVVIGAEYGHGKRSKVLSDYTFAVRDEQTGELKTIGKAYTGLRDQEIAELTAHFLKAAVRQHGRYFEVPPDTVLEIAFDRLQRSERHNSGLAMRFPRIARIRTDKSVAEIDTVQTAERLLARLEANEPATDAERTRISG